VPFKRETKDFKTKEQQLKAKELLLIGIKETTMEIVRKVLCAEL
jgi:hypothetical protein